MNLKLALPAAATVIALLALAACSSSEPASTKPTFGGPAPTYAADDLAAAKADAGIRDCPVADRTVAAASGDDALPDITLPCLGGGSPVDLAQLAGKPTVINLWATWCVPCRKELPLLARADEALGDRVQFIGIDLKDPQADQAIELARASGVTYPLLADVDQQTVVDLKVVGLPQTMFVDAQGTIVSTVRGDAFRSYADLTAAIEEHLGVTP